MGVILLDPSEQDLAIMQRLQLVTHNAIVLYQDQVREHPVRFPEGAIEGEIHDFVSMRGSELERILHPESIRRDVVTAADYGLLVCNICLDNIYLTLDLEDETTFGNPTSTELAGRAAPVMRMLPLTSGEDRLSLIRQYARIVCKAISEREPYAPILNALIDEKGEDEQPFSRFEAMQRASEKMQILVSFLTNQDWIDAVMNPVGSIPVPYTGGVFVDEEHTVEGEDALAESITAYDYYGREVGLLEQHAQDLVTEILAQEGVGSLTLTDLGVGADKFLPIAKAFDQEGYALENINLVDISKPRIEDATQALAGELSETEIHPVNARFEDLERTALANSTDVTVTTYLGTTFCNHRPEDNFKFLRATGAKYAVVGIYLLPEKQKDRWRLVNQYNSPGTRKHINSVGRLMGVREKDLEIKCDMKVGLVNEDWSAKYEEGFEQVAHLVASLQATGNIETPFVQYRPENVIGGARSYKLTDEQFRTIADKHDFDVVKAYRDDGVCVYLLQDRLIQ